MKKIHNAIVSVYRLRELSYIPKDGYMYVLCYYTPILLFHQILDFLYEVNQKSWKGIFILSYFL